MSTSKPTLLLGAHMSIAGGPAKAIERGGSIGCTAIQIFTKSNRQWKAKKLTQEEIDTFKKSFKQSSIESVIAHASYLINLGSPNKETEEKSLNALVTELERCDALGIKYLVVHPGAHLKSDEEKCLQQIARNIDKALERAKVKAHVLLENMAGQGSNVGYTLEQLATIYKHIKNKRAVGFCFDTCHAFAAGYSFSTPKEYKAFWKDFDRVLGLNKLKAIHINDSKKPCGSRVDRHEDIGKGKIGIEGFALILNDPNFFDVPKVLETPKDEDLQDDVRNMNTLKKTLTTATKKKINVLG